MEFSSSCSRWAALTTRNRLADAYFVYAVKTTKIYCRPSCAARLARRANVEFYRTPAAAKKAGYRACKRCKPDLEPQDDPQDVAVAKACEIIRAALSSTEHADGHIGLNELAERVGLTPSYLHKTFKAKMGMTPKTYAENLRSAMEASAAPAQDDTTPISDTVSYDCHSTLANEMTGLDFDFGDVAGLNAVSDSTGPTSGVFSEDSTSMSTPMTTDWSWFDASSTESEECTISDGETLAQAILAQNQADWNDLLYSPREKDWDLLPDVCVQHDLFYVESEFGRISY